MEEREAYIALNMLEHVGPVRVRKLLEQFGTAVAILGAKEYELNRVPGIGPDVAASIGHWESNADISGELERVRQFGCRVLIQTDDEYPALLKQIYDPPIVLYVRGNFLPADNHSVAIVGSRLTTSYGIEVARRLSYQLGLSGVTVASGGARGIDTAAHQGVLNAGGRTICVLGTGINYVFPSENGELYERISASGAVATQFPFNRPGDKQSFPIRNRIVAGMTLGTVVVEANLTSGALITANMAVDCGRQIFAVPGRVDSPRSKGCHDLIKKGAKLCECAEDILAEFEYLFPSQSTSAATSSRILKPLSDDEKKILEILEGEMGMDDVTTRSELSPSAVAVALVGLELKQLVKQLPGRLYMAR